MTAEFTCYVKSTYRVLLTRGLRGCYVYFMDAPTGRFVLSRTEHNRSDSRAPKFTTHYETREAR